MCQVFDREGRGEVDAATALKIAAAGVAGFVLWEIVMPHPHQPAPQPTNSQVNLSALAAAAPVNPVWDPRFDVNGDGVIDMIDLQLVAAHFMVRRGDSRYVAAYDFNADGIINLKDLVLMAQHYGATAPVTTTLNTLATIVGDVTLPHQGCVKGTAGYDWQNGPVIQNANPPSGLTRTTDWAMLDWDCQHDIASVLNVAVAVRGFMEYVLVGSAWQQLISTIYGSQINAPNFGGAIYGDAGAGPNFVVPHGEGVQFYGPQTAFPSGTRCLFVTYQAKLVLANPSLPDQLAQAYILANAGADWWSNSDNAGAVVGRLKLLTTNWQPFNAVTSVALVQQYPPPLV